VPDHASLLSRLLELLLDARQDPLVAIGVARLGEEELDPGEGPGVELYLRPLHAVDDLVGFTAPALWDGIGVVASGTAVGERPARRREPVEVAHLCLRDGSAVTSLRGADGERLVDRTGPDATRGIVPDLCRRALGLPTPAPVEAPTEVFDTLWLDRILAEALDRDLGDPPLSRADALAAFPAAVPRRAGAVELREARARAAASWADLRRRVGLGRLHVRGLSRREAQWMDDGLFARWVLSSLPPLDELATDVDALLPREVGAMVREVLGHGPAGAGSVGA
jgi:hypothetical protein